MNRCRFMLLLLSHRRVRTGVYDLRTHRLLRSDPIYFFGIFTLLVPLSEKRPMLLGQGVSRLGSPQPFIAATEVKCWDFSSFVLLSEKRPNVVGSRSANCLRDTAAPCHGNPNQMLGLLILLVSFEKKTIMARDRILTITGESPRFGGTFLYGYSIAYFLRIVKSFV